MSIYVMTAVWQHATEAAGNELVVLLALADWANDDGLSWHSVPRIAEKAHIHVSTVQRSIQRLVELGYLEIEYGGQDGRSTNRYYVQVRALLEGVANRYPRGGSGAAPGVAALRPDTKGKPNINQTPTHTNAPARESVLSTILAAAEGTDPKVGQPPRQQTLPGLMVNIARDGPMGDRRWLFFGKKPKASRGTKAPDRVQVTEAGVDWAKSKGWTEYGTIEDIQESADACLTHYRGTGKPYADWEAAVDTWIRNDILKGVDVMRANKRAHGTTASGTNVQRGISDVSGQRNGRRYGHTESGEPTNRAAALSNAAEQLEARQRARRLAGQARGDVVELGPDDWREC